MLTANLIIMLHGTDNVMLSVKPVVMAVSLAGLVRLLLFSDLTFHIAEEVEFPGFCYLGLQWDRAVVRYIVNQALIRSG